MKCCWFCGLEFKELQVCSKCQQEFCIEHIDPINHDCVGYPVPNPFELEEEVILLHEVKDEQEIVEFRGARIYQGEVNTIIGLEQFLTEVFKSVKELPTTVRTSKPWFVVKENHISKISFSKGTNIEILEHLKELKWLETLKAYEMDLIKLPESIGNLTALQHLDLRYNHIKTLPESLTSLSLLKTLYLESNEITELPEFIGNLTYKK